MSAHQQGTGKDNVPNVYHYTLSFLDWFLLLYRLLGDGSPFLWSDIWPQSLEGMRGRKTSESSGLCTVPSPRSFTERRPVKIGAEEHAPTWGAREWLREGFLASVNLKQVSAEVQKEHVSERGSSIQRSQIIKRVREMPMSPQGMGRPPAFCFSATTFP